MDDTKICLKRFAFRKDWVTDVGLLDEEHIYKSGLRLKQTTHETELYHFYSFLIEHPDLMAATRFKWEEYDGTAHLSEYRVSQLDDYVNLRLVMIFPTQAIVLYRLEKPGYGVNFLVTDYVS